MSPAVLRIGFAGANAERGWAQVAHLPAIRALPGLEIAAVLNRSTLTANAAAAGFGAGKAYTDISSLVNDPDIDIVAVTVRVPEHRAIVLAALAAGKHVYCEWPLGCNLTEAQEMAEAARHSTVHVAIGTQGPLAPAVRHAARLVQDGAIGRPLNLRMVSPSVGWGTLTTQGYAYLEDERNGATLASIPGGHSIAAIEAVIGPYVEIDARTSTLREEVHIEETGERVAQLCPDHVLVIGRHAAGCISSLEVVGGTIDTPFQFELRGTKGVLSITGQHLGGFQCAELTVSTVPATAPQPEPAASGLNAEAANVAELWAAFAADIRNGTRTVPDFNAAVRLTRVLDAINCAAETGRRQILKD